MEWISVKDSLPELYQTVIVCVLRGHSWEENRKLKIYTAYYGNDYLEKWQVDCDCTGNEVDKEIIDPIFWMPLPDLPKE